VQGFNENSNDLQESARLSWDYTSLIETMATDPEVNHNEAILIEFHLPFGIMPASAPGARAGISVQIGRMIECEYEWEQISSQGPSYPKRNWYSRASFDGRPLHRGRAFRSA
jgi:hypothetical protein